MIVINKTILEKFEDGNVVSSIIEMNDEKRKLWFKISNLSEDLILIEQTDAFLIAILFLALKKGENILIKGTISHKLLHNVNNYLIGALCLSNSSFKPIHVETEKLSETDRCIKKVGATGISCGVDSFATYFKHNQDKKSFKIEYLTFFNVGSHGDFGGEKAREVFNNRFNQANQFAKDVNLSIIKIDSNLSEFLRFNFLQTNTLRNVSCVLLLQKVVKNYYLASKNRFDTFKLNPEDNQDFDTLILPLVSTESTNIHSAVSNFQRTERTYFISNFDLTYIHLDVCTNPSASGNKNNCSICSKCMRTQLTLDLYGRLKNYTAVFHLENYYERKDKFIAEIYNTRKLDPFSADIYELIVKKEQFQLKHKILSKCLKIRKSYVNSKKKLKKILRK
jgi:hypothetical protein